MKETKEKEREKKNERNKRKKKRKKFQSDLCCQSAAELLPTASIFTSDLISTATYK